MNGVERIAAERERQIETEGWTADHDEHHDRGQLAAAASVYAMPAEARFMQAARGSRPVGWPWESEWWKPTPQDRIRELAKAGALIAAEIDRLQLEAAT